jgi:hypothetical protein
MHILWEISDLENQIEYLYKSTEELAQNNAFNDGMLKLIAEKYDGIECQSKTAAQDVDKVIGVHNCNLETEKIAQEVNHSLTEDLSIPKKDFEKKIQRVETLQKLYLECAEFAQTFNEDYLKLTSDTAILQAEYEVKPIRKNTYYRLILSFC